MEAIRLGALDPLGKPLDVELLDEVARRAFEMGSRSEAGLHSAMRPKWLPTPTPSSDAAGP